MNGPKGDEGTGRQENVQPGEDQGRTLSMDVNTCKVGAKRTGPASLQ